MMFARATILLALISVAYSCTTSHITVTGTVSCDDHYQEFVLIELREHDTFTPDDSLNKTSSNNEGKFTIYGEDCEIGSIEPYLRITHKCDGGVINPHCTITDDFPIPKDQIGKTYKMGIVSLNIARGNRQKHCD
uniref:Transthyretin-like family protein n=1 Tax=Syphacia muris TaxID=451379 RepID=A0A0N5AV90_9BILA